MVAVRTLDSRHASAPAERRVAVDSERLRLLAEIAEIEDAMARLRGRPRGLATINLWCLEELLWRRRASLAACDKRDARRPAPAQGQ